MLAFFCVDGVGYAVKIRVAHMLGEATALCCGCCLRLRLRLCVRLEGSCCAVALHLCQHNTTRCSHRQPTSVNPCLHFANSHTHAAPAIPAGGRHTDGARRALLSGLLLAAACKPLFAKRHTHALHLHPPQAGATPTARAARCCQACCSPPPGPRSSRCCSQRRAPASRPCSVRMRRWLTQLRAACRCSLALSPAAAPR